MELKEFYDSIGGDFKGTLDRLYKEDFVKRFVIKFVDDKSYPELKENLAKDDIEEAFRSVHTLKGVAANLGFTKLYSVSSTLTEALRHKKLDNVEALVNNVDEEYDRTLAAIHEFIKL